MPKAKPRPNHRAKRSANPSSKPSSPSPPAKPDTTSLPEQLPPVRPIHTFTHGRVCGKIWLDESDKTPAFTLTVERANPDSSTSTTFEAADIRHLARVATDSAKWIEWQQQYRSQKPR